MARADKVQEHTALSSALPWQNFILKPSSAYSPKCDGDLYFLFLVPQPCKWKVRAAIESCIFA